MIETLAFVLTGIGLTASIVYYANILNNANKTRELQLKAQEMALDTRQAQMFMQIYNQYSSSELKKAIRILRTLEWNSFEEAMQLFDPENPETIENYDAFSTVLYFYEGVGVLVKEDILDIKWVALLMAGMTRDYWDKFAPYVSDIRDAIERPRFASEWEYLYTELMKYIEDHPELAT